MIAPTAGRILWVRGKVAGDFLITKVRDNGHLDGWYLSGHYTGEFHEDVPLQQPSTDALNADVWCEWMPFQVEQEDDGKVPPPPPPEPEPKRGRKSKDADK